VERKKPARKREPRPEKGSRWGLRGMTVRDWLPIVGALLIPLAVAAGTWWITWQQGRIADQRAEADRELAEQRAQDEALQAYLNQMSSFLLEKDLRLSTRDNATEDSKEARNLARARTLTVLRTLDSRRKEQVMQFLMEATLVQTVGGKPIVELSGAYLNDTDLVTADLGGAELSDAKLSSANLSDANLGGANLSDANLSDADLSNAYLRGAILSDANLLGAYLSSAELSDANLSGAYLFGAELSDANLGGANLSGAILSAAYLFGADLSNVDLSGAYVSRANLRGANLGNANLFGANLGGANLRDANLSDANLSDANLSDANLSDANLEGTQEVSDEQLAEAKSLTGATMPNGQKYEDWLKSKGSGEDGENTGPQ
jgi:uncharacterized protein YjbI with pentapeptide repeats